MVCYFLSVYTYTMRNLLLISLLLNSVCPKFLLFIFLLDVILSSVSNCFNTSLVITYLMYSICNSLTDVLPLLSVHTYPQLQLKSFKYVIISSKMTGIHSILHIRTCGNWNSLNLTINQLHVVKVCIFSQL